jgi:hypothetical protein
LTLVETSDWKYFLEKQFPTIIYVCSPVINGCSGHQHFERRATQTEIDVRKNEEIKNHFQENFVLKYSLQQ